jgi:S1-C subfamily serine protease
VLVKGSRHTSLYLELVGAPAESAAADALVMVGGPSPTIESPHLSVETVTDYLRPVPVYRGGVINGFQVYPGRRAVLFGKGGLQRGDVITDLDGQPVSDADQLMDTLRGLMQGESLTATVQRGGATLSVTLDGADVEQLKAANNTQPTLLPEQPIR